MHTHGSFVFIAVVVNTNIIHVNTTIDCTLQSISSSSSSRKCGYQQHHQWHEAVIITIHLHAIVAHL